MNYLTVYINIIRKAKKSQVKRRLDKKNGEYFENHHIIPDSCGGSNHSYNKVLLEASEHFIAHRVLARACKQIYGEKHQYTIKMVHAEGQFIYRKADKRAEYKITSRTYEILRKKHSELQKLRVGWHHKESSKKNMGSPGKPKSEEHKKKLSLAKKGIKWSPEAIAKRRASNTGKKRSLETKDKMRKSAMGRLHTEETRKKMCKPKSMEHRANIVKSAKTRPPVSEETRKKNSIHALAYWQKRKSLVHLH